MLIRLRLIDDRWAADNCPFFPTDPRRQLLRTGLAALKIKPVGYPF